LQKSNINTIFSVLGEQILNFGRLSIPVGM
jgi:hypothetical protein